LRSKTLSAQCLPIFFDVSLRPEKKMNPWLYTIPFISAFIHWLTIWMALKLLFHPREPRKILGLTIQGVFPKRKEQIASNLGRIVGQELLSFHDIESTISNPGNTKMILPLIENHIDDFLKKRLKTAMPILSIFISEKTIRELKSVFMNELEGLFPVIMKSYAAKFRDQLDLEKIVVEKITNFSSDRLESMLNQILTKEFRFVEWIGAALGFLIGWLQILLTLLIK
jgi:uncharacterized membrane protein YheB (UPF0754 family)